MYDMSRFDLYFILKRSAPCHHHRLALNQFIATVTNW